MRRLVNGEHDAEKLNAGLGLVQSILAELYGQIGSNSIYLLSYPEMTAPRAEHQRPHTETSYSGRIKRHIFFHGKQHPVRE
jgi:hypothetical protein